MKKSKGKTKDEELLTTPKSKYYWQNPNNGDEDEAKNAGFEQLTILHISSI